MSNKNIWSNFDFSDSMKKTAFEYLKEQSSDLIEATKGILKIDLEAIDVIIEDKQPKPGALYILYVVAPFLGNFRKKIISVIENRYDGRFPVDIMSHVDDKQYEKIEESNFIGKIEFILSQPLVKNSIEDLYSTSKDYLKNHPEHTV